jgi:hypothetical protein
MTLSKEDWDVLKSNDGYIIYLGGDETPVGPGFDYQSLREVFYSLVEERGVEETARLLGYTGAEEMVLDMAGILDSDYTIDDLVLDACDGQAVDSIDYEADAADHKGDELAGR